MKRAEFGWNRGEWLWRLPGDCPLTWVVLGANAVTFLIAFLGSGAVSSALVFRTFAFAAQPWTAITYPLVADGHILWLLIAGYVFWLFGGSLQRSWGRRDYLLFLGLTAAASTVGLWLGSVLFGRGALLAGLGCLSPVRRWHGRRSTPSSACWCTSSSQCRPAGWA